MHPEIQYIVAILLLPVASAFGARLKPSFIDTQDDTIGGEIKTIRNVTLCNSYRGIDPRMFNGVSFANIRGTVLASGIRGVESSEVSWVHDVTFTPDVWINSAGDGMIDDTAAISVGGGSQNGRLEQICFSFGPWLEAGRALSLWTTALKSTMTEFWQTMHQLSV